MTIPMNAIDPDAAHRSWRKQFEWHLDCVPPIMDTLVTMTLPSIKASVTDKMIVTGGGFVDNMRLLDALAVNGSGQVVDADGVITDARGLWIWIVEYTYAVNAWITPTRNVPIIDGRLNPDPLAARGLALTTVGWLIDHADQIEPIHELDDHRDAMFALIRHLRGRYGVHRHPRRARPTKCEVCEANAVVVDWTTSPDGTPRSVQIGRCRECGATYEDRTTNLENRS